MNKNTKKNKSGSNPATGRRNPVKKTYRSSHSNKALTTTRNGFSMIHSSPWRHIRFTVQIDAPPGEWGRVTTDSVTKALHLHLGFQPSGDRYLEIRLQSVTARAQVQGTALAMRTYRIHPTDNSGNITASIESYSTSAITYPTCTLSFDSVSRATPITRDASFLAFALYPHIVTGDAPSSVVIVAVISLLYRHSETPFENESTFQSLKIAFQSQQDASSPSAILESPGTYPQ